MKEWEMIEKRGRTREENEEVGALRQKKYRRRTGKRGNKGERKSETLEKERDSFEQRG